VSLAAMNKAEATSVILANSDVEFGKYDSGTKVFTVLSAANEKYATAVRVNVHHDQVRNGAIPMTLPGLLGQKGMNLQTKSMCWAAQRYFGIVGLDWVKFTGSNGASKLDSYDSVQGPYDAVSNCGDVAAVASNGGISLGGGSVVNGEGACRRRIHDHLWRQRRFGDRKHEQSEFHAELPCTRRGSSGNNE